MRWSMIVMLAMLSTLAGCPGIAANDTDGGSALVGFATADPSGETELDDPNPDPCAGRDQPSENGLQAPPTDGYIVRLSGSTFSVWGLRAEEDRQNAANWCLGDDIESSDLRVSSTSGRSFLRFTNNKTGVVVDTEFKSVRIEEGIVQTADLSTVTIDDRVFVSTDEDLENWQAGDPVLVFRSLRAFGILGNPRIINLRTGQHILTGP